MKEAKSMFLVTFSIRDGENEHISYKVVFASTERKATTKALKWVADYFLTGTVRDEQDGDLFWSEDETRTIRLCEVKKTTVGDLVKTLLIE